MPRFASGIWRRSAQTKFGISRARMTQIMNLLALSPKVQERVLMGEVLTSERSSRPLIHIVEWEDQTTSAT